MRRMVTSVWRFQHLVSQSCLCNCCRSCCVPDAWFAHDPLRGLQALRPVLLTDSERTLLLPICRRRHCACAWLDPPAPPADERHLNGKPMCLWGPGAGAERAEGNGRYVWAASGTSWLPHSVVGSCAEAPGQTSAAGRWNGGCWRTFPAYRCCLCVYRTRRAGEGQWISPARVRRAVEATCMPLGGSSPDAVLTYGRGLLQVSFKLRCSA